MNRRQPTTTPTAIASDQPSTRALLTCGVVAGPPSALGAASGFAARPRATHTD